MIYVILSAFMLFYVYKMSNHSPSPIIPIPVGGQSGELPAPPQWPQRGGSGAGACGNFPGGVSEAMEAAQGDESHREAERQNQSDESNQSGHRGANGANRTAGLGEELGKKGGKCGWSWLQF